MAIIISVKTNIYDASFDVEVPDDVAVSKVTKDLVECMMSLFNITINVEDVVLSCERLDVILDPSATLAEQGVWNGDYLELTYYG
ncbi:MAG: EsaB/YukD family protein [Clostridiales bacterium]|nr:EsaB/YukD family protein [Clostridiales bacterium]